MTEADDATAALILQVQLQDLRELRSESLDDSSDRISLDFALAARLYEETLSEEAQTISHHHVGHQNETPPASPIIPATPSSDEVNITLGLTTDEQSTGPAVNMQSTDSELSSGEFEAFYEPLTQCVICDDAKAKGDTLTVPCDHDYCDDCLNELFDLASKDESMWPASCCRQQIPLQQAKLFLALDVAERFQAKSEEFGTIDRTYCSKPDCSVFLSPTLVDGDKISCKACGTETCTICKAAGHDGDCPSHPAVQSLMEFAETRGLRQCYSCKRMIELDTGCFHMM